MTTTYRVDYEVDRGDGRTETHVSRFDGGRHDAQAFARRITGRKTSGVRSAYVIRTDDGVDVGQRVYVEGVRSHDDDLF